MTNIYIQVKENVSNQELLMFSYEQSYYFALNLDDSFAPKTTLYPQCQAPPLHQSRIGTSDDG